MSVFTRTVLPPAADVSADEPISVLVALSPNTDPTSLKGVIDVFSQTLATGSDKSTRSLFSLQTCGDDDVYNSVKAALPANLASYLPVPVMTILEATEDPLDDFDILVVPHCDIDKLEQATTTDSASATVFGHSRRKSYNNADTVAIAPEDQTSRLIAHWAAIQSNNTDRERSLLTIGSGTLSAARAGALRRLAASIHPSMVTRLELECQAATLSSNPSEERTWVVDDSVDANGAWYVVSNGRFDLEEAMAKHMANKAAVAAEAAAATAAAQDEALDVVDDELPSPRIASSNSFGWGAIPGTVGRRLSRRRESIDRRTTLPVGGMRVITASEPAAATDSALYLVAAMHSLDKAKKIAGGMGHDWRKGMTVGSVDV